MGGFKVFIFYGFCFFGFVGKVVYDWYVIIELFFFFLDFKLILDRFGVFKNIKVCFVGFVIFGQIFVIEMWCDGKKVFFQIKVKEIGKLVIVGVVVELMDGGKSKI